MKRAACVLIVCLLVSVRPCSGADNNCQGYYFAIKGGVSLGNYESGLNWAIINDLRDPKNGRELMSFSGASAGSINALISVIDYFREDKHTGSLLNNLYKNSWDVGLNAMLGMDQEDAADRTAGGGIFLRAPLWEKIDEVRSALNQPQTFLEHPPVYISFSVTKFEALKRRLGKTDAEIKQHRFVIPLKVSVAGEKLVFENVEMPVTPGESRETGREIPYYIHLPTLNSNTDKVDSEDVMKAALASSAFPVAFSPVELRYSVSDDQGKTTGPCYHEQAEDTGFKGCQTDYFSDGGLFDNSPIGVAMDFVAQLEAAGQERFCTVYIEPAALRPVPPEENSDPPPERYGLVDYADYLLSAFSVGTSQLYYTALRKIETKDNVNYYTSTRRFPLAGNYHAHFSAFYSEDFRLHDYLVGVYDGVMYRCNAIEDDAHRKSCMQTAFKEWFTEQGRPLAPASQLGDDLGNAYGFLLYLYENEFEQKADNSMVSNFKGLVMDPAKNPLIVISRALQHFRTWSSEKHQCEDTKKEEKASFECFLSELSQAVKNKPVYHQFSEESRKLIDSYPDWKAAHFDPVYDRLMAMQEGRIDECRKCRSADAEKPRLTGETAAKKDPCEKICNEKSLREKLQTGLIVARPFIESSLQHADSDIWPLSMKFKSLPRFSFYYGFDVRESSQLFSLKPVRVKLMPKLSLDAAATYHYLSRDRSSDHYPSVSGGLTWHFDQFVIPTFEAGYEYAFAGEKYDRALSSVYTYIGLLNELLRVGGTYRLDNVDDLTVPDNPRSQMQLMILIDVTKISSAVFKSSKEGLGGFFKRLME